MTPITCARWCHAQTATGHVLWFEHDKMCPVFRLSAGRLTHSDTSWNYTFSAQPVKGEQP